MEEVVSVRETADLAVGDVVVCATWPGYLWGVEPDQKHRINVKLSLVLPPPSVPWRNAPKFLQANSFDLTPVVAMEVLALATDRDETRRGEVRRRIAYRKLLKLVRNLWRQLENTKRRNLRTMARARLNSIYENHPEIAAASILRH